MRNCRPALFLPKGYPGPPGRACNAPVMNWPRRAYRSGPGHCKGRFLRITVVRPKRSEGRLTALSECFCEHMALNPKAQLRRTGYEPRVRWHGQWPQIDRKLT